MLKSLAALLFVAGDEGIGASEICQLLAIDTQTLEHLMKTFSQHLAEQDVFPIELAQYGDRYLLVTQSAMEDLIEQYAQTPLQHKLSRPAIETLAIIAYRQPITRMAIDEIRGVSSQAMLQRLLSRQLIKEVGKLDAPGRPLLYGVTDYFLNYFALSSLDELPPIEPLALNSRTASEELFALKRWEIQLDQEVEE